MKPRLKPFALWGAGLAMAGFLVVASGLVPIKASSGHWAVTEWFLRFTLKRSIATHSLAVDVPDDLDSPALIRKGATYYEVGCRFCHGEPGRPLPRVPTRMLPRPPDLAERVRESNPQKLFLIVKDGVKFTGMPAWPSGKRDDEVWAMVAFLLQYPNLNPATYDELSGRNEIAPGLSETFLNETTRSVVAQSCVRCHANEGLGRVDGTTPKLSGQRAEYMHKALDAYAAGGRHSGIMEPIANALTTESRKELALFYAGAPARIDGKLSEANAENPVNGETIARGRTIALEGIRDQRVPACVECHSIGGRRTKPEFPLLAGQPAAYLELQLRLFREDRRGGSDHAHLMKPVASRMTPAQAHDVAAYFASLMSNGSIAPGENPP